MNIGPDPIGTREMWRLIQLAVTDMPLPSGCAVVHDGDRYAAWDGKRLMLVDEHREGRILVGPHIKTDWAGIAGGFLRTGNMNYKPRPEAANANPDSQTD